MKRRGFVVAAPASGSGKTLLTMGLLRALADAGHAPAPFKTGPDFIDPGFHTKAARRQCYNLDPWSMGEARLLSLVAGAELAVVEGVMGLFDGAADGSGSTADLAQILGLPIVLVIDCARQAQSVAALVHGMSTWRSELPIAGVLLNRVGSARHETILRKALAGTRVFGVLPNAPDLRVPSRHLGLVQADDLSAIDETIERAGGLVGSRCDIGALNALPAGSTSDLGPGRRLPPLGQRVALARDAAFSFVYPHILDDWREQGAEIACFSPLADEGPPPDCDAVFLPGGYPELHGGVLAAAGHFRSGLQNAARRGATIYGECGGFMVLGRGIVDRDEVRHEGTGLLPVETSIAKPKRTLGYRRIACSDAWPFGDLQLRGHEFHYSTASIGEGAEAPFGVRDAEDNDLGRTGLRLGTVGGSYLHVVDVDS